MRRQRNTRFLSRLLMAVALAVGLLVTMLLINDAKAAQLRVEPAVSAPDSNGVVRLSIHAEGVPAPGLRSYALQLDFAGPVDLLATIDSSQQALPADRVSCAAQLEAGPATELVLPGAALTQLRSGQGQLVLDSVGSGSLLIAENRIAGNSAIYNVGVAGPLGTVSPQSGDGALLEIRCFVGAAVPAGQVVSVTPALHSTLSGVVLLADPSLPPVIDQLVKGDIQPQLGLVPVPDLAGLDRTAARAALLAAGFVEGRVWLGWSASVPIGQTRDQQPAAGTPLAPGNSIDFTLSEGPAPNPPPSADQDADLDVDRDDLALIEAQLGNPAQAGGDPLDVNGDGRIDESDLQTAVGQCHRPGCGTNDADGDRSPVVVAPADRQLIASGALTAVDIGAAVVSAAAEGPLQATVSQSGNFRPGGHTLVWRATDAAGRSGSDSQRVEITPLAGLAVDQSVAEGGAFTVTAVLNGHAVNYPVTLPFSVTGSSQGAVDHNAVDGSISIASGTHGSATFSSVADVLADDGETVIFTLGAPLNAALGPRVTHTVTLAEDNLAPRVAIVASQAGVVSRDIVMGGGALQLEARPGDPNAADTHSVDWSASASCLQGGASAVINPDPAACVAGVQVARVAVSDGALAAAAELPLRLLASAPVLGAGDSDGDGSSDSAEGLADADGDGIPAWRDRYAHPGLLTTREDRSDGWLLDAEPGLSLALGEVAFAAGLAGSEVSVQQIADHYALAVSGLDSAGGLRDLRMAGLGRAGQSVRVVLPQKAMIPAHPVYRLFNPRQLTVNFVDDGQGDTLASALGAEGLCPPPGHADYLPGLTAGHWCVQLTVRDGGSNDADGVANTWLWLLGGVVNLPPADNGGGGGGCTLNPHAEFDPLLPLLVLFALIYLRRRRHG